MNYSLAIFYADVLSAPAGTYYVRTSAEKESHCQLEIDLFVDDLVVHQPIGPWQKIAPLRILSFDIECVTESGKGFPVPEKDSVIQIASVLKAQGQGCYNRKNYVSGYLPF